MKRIIVTGASGFIGSKFIQRHAHKFSGVDAISRSNYETIDNLVGQADAVVHIAYDRGDVKNNIKVLKHLIDLCLRRQKKFVFISTFAVYDQQLRGTVNEQSPYSRSKDPYTNIKQTSEALINKAVDAGLQAVILQPTIVYGLPGNWSLHAAKSVASGTMYLPKAGNAICNAVHVDDVADAIMLAIEKDVPAKSARFIISGENPVTWKEFYQLHQFLAGNKFEIHDLINAHRYADKLHERIIYRLLFSRPGFMLLSLMPLAKRWLGRGGRSADLAEMLRQGKQLTAFVPKGMSRVYHSTEFTTSIEKATSVLGYRPQKSIANFPAETKAEIEASQKSK